MNRVTYLEHSGFAVELPTVILVFDYIRDPSHALKKMLDKAPDKPVIFFVSHNHPSHYDNSIYEIAQSHPREFVMSNDVPAKDIPDTLDVQGMSATDYIEGIPGLKSVKAYRSTGKGVSFYVETEDGPTIFHAGELNDWQHEPDKKAQDKESAKFVEIIRYIASEHPQVDTAFFPVDVRQGNDFARGAREFLQTIKVKDFFPMHFDGDYRKACNSESYLSPGTMCHCLHEPGQSIDLSHV